jgi:hypothetical protein
MPAIPQAIIDNICCSEIRPSSIHGLGLFATTSIPAGTILGVLDGQVMSWDDYDRIVDSHAADVPEDARSYFFMEWNALSEDTLLVRPFRTKYSYINHSRTPNLRLARHPLRVVTLRDVNEGEELLLDYRDEPLRKEYLDGHGRSFL